MHCALIEKSAVLNLYFFVVWKCDVCAEIFFENLRT